MRGLRQIVKAWLRKTFLVGIVVTLALPVGAAAQSLKVHLEMAHVARDGSVVTLRFTLTNQSRGVVHVLRWMTPLENHRTRLFDITCDGREKQYHGPAVKRLQPNPNQYVRIDGGGSVSAVVDLAEVYDFSRGESCQLRWRHALRDVVEGEVLGAPRRPGDFNRVRVESNEVFFRVGAGSPKDDTTRAISFVGCDETEKQTLREALTTGDGLAAGAESYLDGVPVADRPTDVRYRAWFGAFNTGRYDGVIGLYEQIKTAAAGSVTFNCTGRGECDGATIECEADDFAFTCEWGVGDTIWPCEEFWVAPPTGENSQAGTVVHELSHWFGTNDDEYGCEDCQDLARLSPDDAVENADNCEYFAENFGTVCN